MARLTQLTFVRLTIVVTTNILTTSSMSKGIQAEIKQTKPFKSLEEEVSVALLRTADQLAWRGTEMLKRHGLSPTQYNALRILRGAAEKGLACTEIGERMINRDPDITRLIDRLERRGLVIRSREQKDRRVITTRITTAGLELLRSLDRPVTEFHQELLSPVGERQLRSLLRLLEAVRRRTE
jgi:DNA-binding MarR family transcriptional regulator